MMKGSIKMLLVVLPIVMTFAALQAFGGIEFKNGPEAPNVELTLEIVSGCVLPIHLYGDMQQGITLCSQTPCAGLVNCQEDCDGECKECGDDNITTILGTGPPSYWADCVTLEIGDDGLPIYADGKYTQIDGTFDVVPPAPCDDVTIGFYPSGGEDLIALWVLVETDGVQTAVLLRDQETLEMLW